MSWCTPAFAERNALNWFAQCRSSLAAQSAYEFGVFAPETGRLLGGAGLNTINHQNLLCNLGYWVRESAQGQGVASRTVHALLPYAFDTLNMQRVEIVVAQGNLPSEAVARRCGAEFECIAKKSPAVAWQSRSCFGFCDHALERVQSLLATRQCLCGMGYKARYRSHSRAIARIRNTVDRPQSHGPEGLERNRAISSRCGLLAHDCKPRPIDSNSFRLRSNAPAQRL